LREWRERAERSARHRALFAFPRSTPFAGRIPRWLGAAGDIAFKTAGKTGRPETTIED
jgi:hypothetical protein